LRAPMSEPDLIGQHTGSSPKGVRLGIIGTGWVGLTRARIAAADGRVSELHLADVKRETVLLAAAETNATSYRCDYRALLDADAVDAFIVSTAPEDTHHPIARNCLAAGKHVLLEKPMALTLDEADGLIEVAERTGAIFTVGYSQRFQPKFAYVKEQFDSGALG